MSIYFNQTNITPGDTFSSGGGGGSNFPQGVVIGGGTGTVLLQSGNIPASTGPPLGYCSIPVGPNTGWLANPLWSGDTAVSYLKLTSTTMSMTDGNGSNEKILLRSDVSKLGTANPAFALSNVSTLNGGTIALSNYFASGTPNLLALDSYMLTQNASQGGRNIIRATYDAADTGAVVSCVMGADGNTGTAFVGSEWPGFITMPMAIYGANITLQSDNETFFFLDGKAGAIGSISTGTEFIGGLNTLSSIRDPTRAHNANMTALLSTLQDLYPSCFA